MQGFHPFGAPANLLHHYCWPVCAARYQNEWVPAFRARQLAEREKSGGSGVGEGGGSAAGGSGGAAVAPPVVGGGSGPASSSAGPGLDAFQAFLVGAIQLATVERKKRKKREIAAARAAASELRARRANAMASIDFTKQDQVPPSRL